MDLIKLEENINNLVLSPETYQEATEKYRKLFYLKYKKIIEMDLYSLIIKNVNIGLYDESIFSYYSKDEINLLDSLTNKFIFNSMPYSAIRHFEDKYLLKNRKTGELYESIHHAMILIPMYIFKNIDRSKRIILIRKFYDYLSNLKITLPTPIFSSIRTKCKSGTSCVLIDVDDDINSIGLTSYILMKYTSMKAGIGLNIGRIREKNSIIRMGDTIHPGVVSFLRVYESAIKSSTQGSLRGGSATVFFPFWHPDILDIIVLKNNKGTPETRIRGLDYCVQLNKLFYDRVLNDDYITLFSPNINRNLLEAFYSKNVNDFILLYEKLENEHKNNKKIKARELMEKILTERFETGRIYIQNIDHTNEQSKFKLPITQSNLCVEITLPTRPIYSLNENDDGLIATCILGGLVPSNINSEEELYDICYLMNLFLDLLIEYQTYPFKQAENYTKKYRSLGIGINGLAHYFAKNKCYYGSKKSLKLIHDLSESIQYFLLKSSVELSKEFGPCYGFKDTLYSDGFLPIDLYNKNVDEIYTSSYKHDWEELRSFIKKFGLRNTTLTAQFPAENSSLLGTTNGIEPPRDFISVKVSKYGNNVTLVPEYDSLKDYYTLLWDIKNKDYLSIVAIIQKFFDQSISTNLSYNPEFYSNNKIPLSELVDDLFWCYKYGIKTIYYNNVFDLRENSIIETNNNDCEGSCKL